MWRLSYIFCNIPKSNAKIPLNFCQRNPCAAFKHTSSRLHSKSRLSSAMSTLKYIWVHLLWLEVSFSSIMHLNHEGSSTWNTSPAFWWHHFWVNVQESEIKPTLRQHMSTAANKVDLFLKSVQVTPCLGYHHHHPLMPYYNCYYCDVGALTPDICSRSIDAAIRGCGSGG